MTVTDNKLQLSQACFVKLGEKKSLNYEEPLCLLTHT